MTDVDTLTRQAAEYHQKGEYDQAIENHLEALKILEESAGANDIDTAKRYSEIGSAAEAAGCFDNAMEHFSTALNMMKDLDDTDESKILRGKIFQAMGNLLFKQEDYMGAQEHFSNAKEVLNRTSLVEKTKLDEIDYLIELCQQLQVD